MISVIARLATGVGDVGIGVIKNGGKFLYGSGKAAVGYVIGDADMVSEGLSTARTGAVGTGAAFLKRKLKKDKDNDNNDNNDFNGEVDC